MGYRDEIENHYPGYWKEVKKWDPEYWENERDWIEYKRRSKYTTSNKAFKKLLHRAERRKARINVECIPTYKQYSGWEF